MPSSTMLSRAAFLTFTSLLACLTSATVICFSMAILEDAFVYAGIGCLTAVVLLIGTYTGCRYLCRTDACVEYLTRGEGHPDVADQSMELEVSQDQFRGLEREIEELFAEASDPQLNSLRGNTDVLERHREDLRKDYDQLIQWVEGRKTPEATEVRELVQRLDNIRNSLRNIRRRSDRINATLGLRHNSSVVVLSRSVDHHPLRLPLQPPPYEDIGSHHQQQQQRHLCLTTERHLNPPPPPPPSVIGITYLPSYATGRRFSLAPPADDHEAPPPYEEFNTGHPLSGCDVTV